MELQRVKKADNERSHWAVVGPAGAVHFWKFENYPRLGGVEEHRKAPADYQSAAHPDHDNCWLIGCPCWHDGSSLYADEFFPTLEVEGEEAIFIKLEWEYKKRFRTADEVR